MKEQKRILNPLDKLDALEIIMQALGGLSGIQMRIAWKAFETIENAINEKLEEKKK